MAGTLAWQVWVGVGGVQQQGHLPSRGVKLGQHPAPHVAEKQGQSLRATHFVVQRSVAQAPQVQAQAPQVQLGHWLHVAWLAVRLCNPFFPKKIF